MHFIFLKVELGREFIICGTQNYLRPRSEAPTWSTELQLLLQFFGRVLYLLPQNSIWSMISGKVCNTPWFLEKNFLHICSNFTFQHGLPLDQ